jgi:hypothetical protein
MRLVHRGAAALGLVWSLAAAALASAQVTFPGAPWLDPTRIRYGTLTYTLSVVQGDEEQVVGTIVDEILPIRGEDPVLQRVRTVRQGGSVTIDSTVTELETLRPRWHHAVQPQRAVLLEFSEAQVTGTVTPVDGPARSIDVTLPDLAFDASNWDLALRALPLEEGDAAVLQLYDVDRQLVRYRVRVADRTVAGLTDLIHVVLEVPGSREVHLWLDEATRTLLRLETQVAEDRLLRQVLQRN